MGTITPDELEAMRRESQQPDWPPIYYRRRLMPQHVLAIMTGCFVIGIIVLMICHWCKFV